MFSTSLLVTEICTANEPTCRPVFQAKRRSVLIGRGSLEVLIDHFSARPRRQLGEDVQQRTPETFAFADEAELFNIKQAIREQGAVTLKDGTTEPGDPNDLVIGDRVIVGTQAWVWIGVHPDNWRKE